MRELWQKDALSTKKEEGETRILGEVTAGKKRFVKRALSDERPTIWIGKSGASDDLLKEIGKQLDKNKMVKVKILKSGIAQDGTKEMASKIAQQTDSALIEVRGHTFMLYKRRKK